AVCSQGRRPDRQGQPGGRARTGSRLVLGDGWPAARQRGAPPDAAARSWEVLQAVELVPDASAVLRLGSALPPSFDVERGSESEISRRSSASWLAASISRKTSSSS